MRKDKKIHFTFFSTVLCNNKKSVFFLNISVVNVFAVGTAAPSSNRHQACKQKSLPARLVQLS